MPMNARLLRPIASGVHPEAAAWRSAVVANGGSVSASTLKAVADFCKAIDAAGIRDKLYRVNLRGLGITGVDGTSKLLINVGATAPITLQHSTGSNDNAYFAVPWAGDYVMDRAGGAALVVYDATSAVWRVV